MTRLRCILGKRIRPQQNCADSHVSPVPYRRFARAGQGLVLLCAGCLLMGSLCFAADVTAPTPATPVADHATETLLRTIMQQIAGGQIISPPDDNAMQTWQHVLQRDIASQGSPEVRKALEDFDTYARLRAAEEKAAGRLLVAAELTVFAEQASRLTGHSPPGDTSGTSGTPGKDTPPGQPGGATATPVQVADDAAPRAQPAAPIDPVGGTATAASGAVSHDRSAGVTASTAEAASDRVLPVRSPGSIASVTEAVMHIAPQMQPFGTTPLVMDTPGGGARVARSVGHGAGAAATAMPHALGDEIQVAAPTPATGRQADSAASVQPLSSGAAPQVPITEASAGNAARVQVTDAGSGPNVATREAPPAAAVVSSAATGDAAGAQSAGAAVAPPDSVALRAEAQGPTAPGFVIAAEQGAAATNAPPVAPVAGGSDPATVSASAALQSATADSAMATFYAGRGDAMLAHRDISAARKFYEYAANAGSARAATALARTYDPAFAAQSGTVGWRPDPELAAVWYRKAAELGGKPAQLSQSADNGK